MAAQRLHILVDEQWLARPKVQELADKGHTIGVAPRADLILSPAAHMWHDELWPFLEVALRAARKRKKEMK